jgi:hypothetical protein
MKQAHGLSAWLIRQLLLCAALIVAAGCATKGPGGGEEPLPAKVVRLRGAARWWCDDDKTLRAIKVGSKLPPGALVQTAAKSRMDIGLGESAPPRPRADSDKGMLYKPDPNSGNLMRLWENSLLRLNQLTRRLTKVGTHIKEQVQVDLRAGHIFLLLRGMAADSQFEIKFPKGFVHIHSGVYDVSAEGVVKVLYGRAAITTSGSTETHEVLDGHMFDARTGVLGRIPTPDY